jgi:hypothetical protein
MGRVALGSMAVAVVVLGLRAPPAGAEEPAAAPTPSPDALIAAARQAMGGAAWDKIVTWHEVGTLTAGGLVGTYEGWQDLTNLHNSGSFALGPTTGGSGWDGTAAWTTDSSQDVRIESSGEAAAQAIQDAYRAAYGLFFLDRFPAAIDAAGDRQDNDQVFDAVTVTPDGAEPFEVWFDPDTHRIAREVQLTGSQRHSFIFLDFEMVDGAIVPRKTLDRVGDDPKYDTAIEVEAIEFGAAEPDSRYAPPPPAPSAAQWPDGADQVTLPFKLLNNHIYVDASINGMPPTPFLFDTGSVNIIQTDAARAMGIVVEGALPGGGFGEGLSDFGLARVDSVSLGGLTLPDQVFGTEMATGWTALEGTNSAGNLGYEFAKAGVLTIDYAKKILIFTKPDAFRPPDGVDAVPLTFNSHIPMLAGSLDGIAGEFQLDTGSRGALTLMATFAASNDLVEKYHAKAGAGPGFGAGGASTALVGRAGQLTIGPVTLEAPPVEILTDGGGAAAAARTAGNIGGQLLKRFTVTLDYAHGQAWLQQNGPGGDADGVDRAGLLIDRAADGCFDVSDIAPGSAALKAGLAIGDEITSVNGQAAPDVDLDALRQLFKGPVGTKVTLTVTGDAGERDIVLTLAEQA